MIFSSTKPWQRSQSGSPQVEAEEPPAPAPLSLRLLAAVACSIACRSSSSSEWTGARKTTPARFIPWVVSGRGATRARAPSLLSPRGPATPSAATASVTVFRIWSGIGTSWRRARPSSTCRRIRRSPFPHWERNPGSSLSKERTRSTICIRNAISFSPAISTHHPKRPNSCGRSSPSSGFIVPTRMNRDGCEYVTPSRITTFRPDTATSSRTSTTWSSRRFTSSMYRRVPFAFPNTPISNFFDPPRGAASRSRLPTPRSSEAFNGRSTTSTGRSSYASDSPCASRDRHFPQGGPPRRQPNRHPDTVSFAGRTAANARTAVVFPGTFSPRIRTPPIEGSTALTRRPFFRSSWPTIALNGKRRTLIPPLRFRHVGAQPLLPAGGAEGPPVEPEILLPEPVHDVRSGFPHALHLPAELDHDNLPRG